LCGNGGVRAVSDPGSGRFSVLRKLRKLVLQVSSEMLQSRSGTEMLCPGSKMLQEWRTFLGTQTSETEPSKTQATVIRRQQVLHASSEKLQRRTR
jgi:hypothetical protein